MGFLNAHSAVIAQCTQTSRRCRAIGQYWLSPSPKGAFGKIHEYFLGKFATAEGQKGGEFCDGLGELSKADRPVADPRVCGDLSQAVPLPLQLQHHHATFLACARNFAHCFLAAFPIFALAAADKTRFFTPTTSRSAEPPNAFAAARTPLSW